MGGKEYEVIAERLDKSEKFLTFFHGEKDVAEFVREKVDAVISDPVGYDLNNYV